MIKMRNMANEDLENLLKRIILKQAQNLFPYYCKIVLSFMEQAKLLKMILPWSLLELNNLNLRIKQ